jgi:hypothetical protein
MVPYSLDTGYGISRAADARLGLMVDRALEILDEWGIDTPARVGESS